MQVDCGFQKCAKRSKSCTFIVNFCHWRFRDLISGRVSGTIMGILQKESRLVSGQEFLKICCLPMLEYFKKLMFHGNSWGFHVRGELVWNSSKVKFLDPEILVKNSETCLFRDCEMSAYYFAWKKRTFSNELDNHLCQIRIRDSSRSWVISEVCSLLQEIVCYFFTTKIWNASYPNTSVSSISFFLTVRLFMIKKRTITRSFISHFSCVSVCQKRSPTKWHVILIDIREFYIIG
jgi:hypothetical protein